MRSTLLSILPIFLKALSLYFGCIEAGVDDNEKDTACTNNCLKIFNQLRQNNSLPELQTLKREKGCDDIAEFVLNLKYHEKTGFGVTQEGGRQWTYTKFRKPNGWELANAVDDPFQEMLAKALEKKNNFFSDPTSIFPFLKEVSPGSVIILGEYLYSYNQLFGQDNSFSLGWAISGAKGVMVLLSEIKRITEPAQQTQKVLSEILGRFKNTLDPFLLQFQATSLAQRLLTLETSANFKGLIEGPGFQASIQIEPFDFITLKIEDDEGLANMLQEIQTEFKSTGNKASSGNLVDTFHCVYNGYSSHDQQAFLQAENIAFGVYENEEKRISVVLYFNAFTEIVRKKSPKDKVFQKLQNASEVDQALTWIRNYIFQNKSSGFGIFDDKYALSFLKCTKTETRQFGVKNTFIKPMLDPVSGCTEINLKLEKIQRGDHFFTLLCEGNSVVDLAQIIATTTNEITHAVIDFDEHYVAVLVTTISAENLKNLPIVVLEKLQKVAGNKFTIEPGLESMAQKFMLNSLKNLSGITTKLDIIKDDYGVKWIAIKESFLGNTINPNILMAATAIKCVERLTMQGEKLQNAFVDCRQATDELTFVTTIVGYENPAWELFKQIKNDLFSTDYTLSLALTKWACEFAKSNKLNNTELGEFALTNDNHIVSTILLSEPSMDNLQALILESEEKEEEEKEEDVSTNSRSYVFDIQNKEDYRVIYNRTTEADLLQAGSAKEVGVAYIQRGNQHICIFAYDASSISFKCLLPLINSYRAPENRINFGDLKEEGDVGDVKLFAPDLSRSPIDSPGLIIDKNYLVTYQVLSDNTGVNGSLVEQIFRFGQTILSSNKDQTYSGLPWTEFNYTHGAIYRYPFLVPNESLAIQNNLILHENPLAMQLRKQAEGLRSMQIFYSYKSQLDDQDQNVGIKLTITDGGTISATKGDAVLHQNRIGGSIVRHLARKSSSPSAGYIVLEDCIVAFVKFTENPNIFDGVKLAELIANSLMTSTEPFSVVESSMAKNSEIFDHKYSIITGSGETLKRLVNSAENGVLGWVFSSDNNVGALVFNHHVITDSDFNIFRSNGYNFEMLNSLNFLANEIASTWAEQNITKNYAEECIRVKEQEFVHGIVFYRTDTTPFNIIGDAWTNIILLKRTQEPAGNEIFTNGHGLSVKFKAGGPPMLIPKLKAAKYVGFGQAKNKNNGGYSLVILFSKELIPKSSL